MQYRNKHKKPSIKEEYRNKARSKGNYDSMPVINEKVEKPIEFKKLKK